MSVALAMMLLATGAVPPSEITIERATVPWPELERLLRKEGAPAPERSGPPHAYAIPSLEVEGEISDRRASLHLVFEIDVLQNQWTVAPVLPGAAAIAEADIEAPKNKRGILARDGDRIVFVAEGAGRYRLKLEVECPLADTRDGRKLAIAPPALTGGRAHLVVHGADRVGGAIAWRTRSEEHGALVVEAALGKRGVDLVLQNAESSSSDDGGAALEQLSAVTVVSLGGRGVTRLLMEATPDKNGRLEIVLPKGAKLWKAFVGKRALSAALVADGELVRLRLEKAAEVEIAYTFDAPRLGIRGRYRVELPKLPVEVEAAHWDLFLPDGLEYSETQSSLPSTACTAKRRRARTEIDLQGRCFGFSRAVLEPQAAYIEGGYAQRF
jgi:hypothetical protein